MKFKLNFLIYYYLTIKLVLSADSIYYCKYILIEFII